MKANCIAIRKKMILDCQAHPFAVCTFWFINSLFRIGEEEKSKELFDKLLTYSNHLGLFNEDLDFKSEELLGNFPQAYSHLALIDNAVNFN